ncbi:MAG: peptidase [Marmoricola sp.]|nr:peptidase [Marmoricola sp.]
MSDQAGPSVRLSLVVSVLTAGSVVVLSAVLIPWHWLPGQHVHAVAASSVFSLAQIGRAERVSWALRQSSWANLVLGLAVASGLGFTGLGSRLMARLRGPWWLRVAWGTAVVSLAGVLVQLPFGVRIQRVEVAEGLSTQSWSGWLVDQATGYLVTVVFTAIALLAIMAVARRAPRAWPAWAAAAAAVLALVGSFAYPVVVEPLSNHFTSMAPGPQRADIFTLAKVEHVHISDVLVADASRRTTTLNAYVSGFGSTRRVVVYDTVLTQLTRPEIDSVVAHELGHARHQDVLVGTILGALGSAFGVGLLGLVFSNPALLRRARVSGIADPRAVPLLLALVAIGALVVSPIQNTMSRAVEARADLASLDATRDPATFIEMQRRLALSALADPTPPGWSQFVFGSHPTPLQRIGMARQWRPGD